MYRFATLALLAVVSAPGLAAPRTKSTRSVTPNVTAGTVCNDVPHLGYPSPGGPLIQHVKVVDVFYSPGHKYKSQLEDFYKAITQSAYFDWLVEYNVANYKISRGSFVTSFEDTNVNPTTVKSLNPETYLKGLLAANKLPPPDDDTIYMMYFPSGIDPTDGSGSSCIKPNGQYCAYHNSYAATGGQNVRYGVMPDMEAGSCSMGCGPPGFPSFTDVSSHELIEAITDPDGTGWYDDAVAANDPNNCGEIGDICAVGGTQETATINGFVVQKEWSNKNKACIGTDANAVVNDFTIAVDPSSVTVPIGGSATVTVTLTKKTGVGESVALTSPAAPTGLTASFAPASVSSDAGTSTMTISAGGSLTPTVLTMNVKGTGSSVSESTLLTVNVVAPVDMATNGTGGGGGSGGSGDHGGGGGCSVGGGSIAGSWAVAALLLFALAFRRRFALVSRR
jgi:MYXO-CTERM domain-containing protein